MPIGRPEEISPDTVVHRVGGGSVANLRLSLPDAQQTPPGISVLLHGTLQEAAAQMRHAFPGLRKWRETAQTVGTTTAATIREARFDVVPDPTTRFPNHARLMHPQGVASFSDEHLVTLATTFRDTGGANYPKRPLIESMTSVLQIKVKPSFHPPGGSSWTTKL